MADVEGSTAAVQAGRYRDVNYLGAAAIAAVLNLAGDTEVPFVFGGDGASLAVPPSLLGPASAALAALRRHAAERFGLTLRVGAVPVRDVDADGHRVRVARLAVSPNYTQALFTGGGLAHADRLVKADETAARYAIPDGRDAGADEREATEPTGPIRTRASNAAGRTCRAPPARRCRCSSRRAGRARPPATRSTALPSKWSRPCTETRTTAGRRTR